MFKINTGYENTSTARKEKHGLSQAHSSQYSLEQTRLRVQGLPIANLESIVAALNALCEILSVTAIDGKKNWPGYGQRYTK